MDLSAALELIADDEWQAREALQTLWDQARQRQDPGAAFQAAAGMLLAIGFHCVDYRGRMPWCARFGAGLDEQPLTHWAERAAAGEPDALRACAAALVWPTLDDNPQVLPANALATAAEGLLRGLQPSACLPPLQRLVLAKLLLDHHSLQMDTSAAARVLVLQQEPLKLPSLSPTAQAHWWFLAMVHHEYFAEAGPAAKARQRLQQLIDAHALPDFRAALLTQDMQIALRAGQLDRAGRIHRELDGLLPELRAGFVTQALRAQASYLTQRGDHGAALALVDRLLDLCADLDVPARDQGAYRVLRANVLVALSRFPEALAELRALRSAQTGGQAEVLAVIIGFTEAAALLPGEPNRARGRLAQVLPEAARLCFNRFFMTGPALAAKLCQCALDADIQPEFVRATIRERRLSAPDPTRADWPWPVKVQVLGGLMVWRDELPLASTGKAQRKPLELLALLAAHGGGPLSSETVIDALWPSLDAEAPKASLEMCVSRLRKLLDCPEALVVSQGSLSLDPARVWCDAVAFEALATRLALRRPDQADQVETAQRLVSLYRGRLLGTDSLHGPMHLARERLAMTHLHSVELWGQTLENRGDWVAATALYGQALAVDALAEPLHRALMRALLARGERAEALRVYRRCRTLLARALGTPPSDATQALGRVAGAPEAWD